MTYARLEGSFLYANEQRGLELRDVWTASYINDLPDSAFLYIEPGGTKDSDGKTVPRTKRHFPVKDANGKPDAAHINNAIARINQAAIPDAAKKAAMTKAKAMSAAHPDIGSGKTSQYEGSAGSGTGRARPVDELQIRSDLLGDQLRTFPLVLEVREYGDGRTLYGRAVPYGQTATINGGRDRERFVPGVFSRQLGLEAPGHIKLYDAHTNRLDGKIHIGKTLRLADQPDGLYGEWQVMHTQAGDDALTMIKEGEVTGLSVGFKALPNGSRTGQDGAIERHLGHLDHVSLTSEPAYSLAGVLAVRDSIERLPDYDAELERLRAIDV